MLEIPTQQITDSSCWSGDEMARDPSWDQSITADERKELETGLAAVKARGSVLSSLSRSDFPIGPALKALASEIVSALRDGRGFIVLRGFPVTGFSDEDIRLMFLGFGQHLGTPVSQDATCALVADVRERHVSHTPGERHYGGKAHARLHVDLTDVVGLLGVRQARDGPLSMLGSVATIFNTILAEHPEWLPRLFRGFYWDRMGEQAPWELPYNPNPVPLFSFADGRLSARYNRGWLKIGADRKGMPLTSEEQEMLDFVDTVGAANAMTFEMQPGDVYFANNYAVFHGRQAYAEEPDWDAASKRLFLRLWLNLRDFRPFQDETAMRFGVISHGNLGWTSRELAACKHLDPLARRIYIEAC